MPNPIRPTDQDAKALARQLIDTARYGALAVFEAESGHPLCTRLAVGTSVTGHAIALISDLAHHTRALRANAACSLLLGEPGQKGDPLTHPRLSLQARARFIAKGAPEYAEMAAHYLRDHPKSKLYIGFADFSFVQFEVIQAYLNGGFGKAFTLTPADLALKT